jgi:hypothetical protein
VLKPDILGPVGKSGLINIAIRDRRRLVIILSANTF